MNNTVPSSREASRARLFELLLSLKSHLEELVPGLAILRHLSDLKPFSLLIQLDGVSHPAMWRNLQTPLKGVSSNLCLRIDVSSLGRKRIPSKRPPLLIKGDKCQSSMNRRAILFGLPMSLND